ncbi:MAG TPA: glycosyltransferase family 4 protein [Acidimicrobiales bacterium]|nr:glycosyltransferase family 4 protein [Acidimicrobiales bacterium]
MSPPPLRIVLVEFSPSGGLFQFSFQMGRALARAGHHVTLLTGPDPEMVSGEARFEVAPVLPTWHPGAGVEPVVVRKLRRPVRAARLVAAWLQVGRMVREIRPDVVQWSEWRFSIDGLLASLIARRGWAGVCADVAHSPIPLQEQRGDAGPYRRGGVLYGGLGRGYRAMDLLLVLGESSRTDLLATWPGVSRVEVIPFGDLGVLAHGDPVDPGDCPEQVVFFGSLTGYKGLDLLLDAFAAVRAQRPAATLKIAGPVVGDLDVKDLARRARAIDGVQFLPGYVPAEDVPGLVGGARLLAAPYRRSNASAVVRLAQTFGRPVVVTDVGDLAESVDDGVTGLVVAPEDTTALASAMVRLLSDPGEASRMGAEGRRRLMEESSWEVVAGRLDALYRSVLETNPAPAAATARRRIR